MTFENILLISWDGVQWKHLAEVGDQLNSLKKLASLGSVSKLANSDSITVTDPGHSQLLTGYFKDQTLIYENQLDQTIPDGLCIWERLNGQKKIFYSSRNCDSPECYAAHAFVRTEFRDGFPELTDEFDPALYEGGDEFVLLPDLHAERCQDGVVMQLKAEYIKNRFLEFLSGNAEKFFAFLHFGEPDAYGHIFGENSAAYTQGLLDCDAATDAILIQLDQMGLLTSTAIFVTTDHGFKEGGFGSGGHWSLPYPNGDPNCYISFLVTNTLQQGRKGLLVDLAPTIFAILGIDPASFEPPLPGKKLWERPLR